MSANEVLSGLGAVREWQEDFYRELHRRPELSHQEQHTAALVAQRLREFGSGPTPAPSCRPRTACVSPCSGIGGIDPDAYRAAEQAGRIAQDIPVNHAAGFAPVVQPTLDTGTQALVVAALAWLGPREPFPG